MASTVTTQTDEHIQREVLRELKWDAEVAPHTDGLYLSFDTDQRPERLHEAFPGETLPGRSRACAMRPCPCSQRRMTATTCFVPKS